MEHFYPAGPTSVPADLTKASAAYKQRAWLAVLGLALFIVLYLGLTGWFVWTAYRVAIGVANGADPTWQGISAGVTAGFLALFMIKALFFVRHHRNTQDVEIKPEEHPQLFDFLHRLADEAGAPRPHKVFLSSDINAAVFYDLSILNLLFPSKKNLLIGLGLVNVLTLSEFKAVLAHEFGHFAQKSMAVGRWVYIAQQIASQIVDRRDALDSFLRFLSRIDIRIAWIGWILSLVVWSIRSLLDSAHKLVILALRALSRQMEFQADLVAVSLTGSDALVHALHKLRTADDAWTRAVGLAREEIAAGRGVKDLFAIQTYILEKLRFIFNDPTYGLIPPIPQDQPEQHRVFDNTIAAPPQMWSTHPESSAREENAKRHYIPCASDTRPAWVIFSNEEHLRSAMTTHVLGEQKVAPLPIENTLQNIEQKFSRTYLMPHFRGIYLGRSFVRHYKHHDELLSEQVDKVAPTDFDQLYPPTLTECLEKLKNLESERQHLLGLKHNALKARDGVIRFRGQTINKRQLAKAISTVEDDIRNEQDILHAHDKKCRAFHIAAAKQVGDGWDRYLKGLVALIHYADHSEADLYDVMALVHNTVAVITADKKVSKRELKRLLKATTDAHGVLAGIYQNAPAVTYDASVANGIKDVATWTEVLGNFTLPLADATNINQWMGVFDNWIYGTANAVSALKYAALETLLQTENKIAEAFRTGHRLEAAPLPPTIPEQYRLLLPGSERKLQTRLGIWDRFQTATGVFPATVRVLVALAIITAVFIWSQTASQSDVSVYNGLHQTVEVSVDGQRAILQPFESRTLILSSIGDHTIKASTRSGELIEEFTHRGENGSNMHFIYNIASAAPLMKWHVLYGKAAEIPNQSLGNQRFFLATADYIFADPPDTISGSKHSQGEARSVISGFGDELPEVLLNQLSADKDKRTLVTTRAQWDEVNSPHYLLWLAIAASYDDFAETLQKRLGEFPEHVGLLRQEQNLASAAADKNVCERHTAKSQSNPSNADWRYLAIRCMEDDKTQNAAFIEAAKQWPEHAWLALAAAYASIGSANWEAGIELFETAIKNNPQLKPLVALDMERVERVLSGEGRKDDLIQMSYQLQLHRTLDTGEGLDHSPWGAYRKMQDGKFDDALLHAANDADVRAEMKRWVAASAGATQAHIQAAIKLDAKTGLNDNNVWSALALAARLKLDEKPYISFIHTAAEEHAEPILNFWAHIKSGKPPRDAEKWLVGTRPALRAQAYVMAAVYLQDRCPKQWRNLANALLFANEKPKLI